MANDLLSQITSAQLRRALAIREEIEKLEGELNSIATGGSASPAPAAKKTTRKYTKKKAVSSEAESEEATPIKAGRKAGKKGRILSPEARAKMADAMRRRWAVKKGTATAKPAAKKAASKKTATKKSAPKRAAAKKASATGGAKKRELSSESRAKMAEAMRRRWAVKRGNR